jgi:nucleotide-binding universal stress UspA family protein
VSCVIAPLDLSDQWQSEAARAADIARRFAAELILVHVLAHLRLPAWMGRGVEAHQRQRIDSALKALERARTKLSLASPSSSRVLVGNPAEEIARLTIEQPRALVVMSLRGNTAGWGARRGSIAYRVLTHAVRPVLALPTRRISGRRGTTLRHK